MGTSGAARSAAAEHITQKTGSAAADWPPQSPISPFSARSCLIFALKHEKTSSVMADKRGFFYG
jgi:hypothetical protein